MALWTMAVIKTCIVKKIGLPWDLKVFKKKSILLIILNFTK